MTDKLKELLELEALIASGTTKPADFVNFAFETRTAIKPLIELLMKAEEALKYGREMLIWGYGSEKDKAKTAIEIMAEGLAAIEAFRKGGA